MNNDPRFVQYFGDGNPLTRYESWSVFSMLVGHWYLKGFGLWLVEDKNTKEFIGRVGCWEPEGWPSVEVAWGITPSFWGNGYATESATATVKWAFQNLGIKKLISIIHPGNNASKSVALRIGETYEETKSINGKISDIFSINQSKL